MESSRSWSHSFIPLLSFGFVNRRAALVALTGEEVNDGPPHMVLERGATSIQKHGGGYGRVTFNGELI